MKAISRESRVALTWEVLYADDLVVIAETEVYLIKRLNEWKNNVENRGMRVIRIKLQKAARWPCGVCGSARKRTSGLYGARED